MAKNDLVLKKINEAIDLELGFLSSDEQLTVLIQLVADTRVKIYGLEDQLEDENEDE